MVAGSSAQARPPPSSSAWACAKRTARMVAKKNSATKDSKYVKEPFIFKTGTEEIVLPSLSYLKPGLVRKIRRMTDVDRMYTIFEEVLDEKELKLLDDLDPEEFEKLCDQWNEHSEANLGES
jgi:CRISPR/Cas system CSM-associated protein Csm2 small subunit